VRLRGLKQQMAGTTAAVGNIGVGGRLNGSKRVEAMGSAVVDIGTAAQLRELKRKHGRHGLGYLRWEVNRVS
jgi:hypothetical protein